MLRRLVLPPLAAGAIAIFALVQPSAASAPAVSCGVADDQGETTIARLVSSPEVIDVKLGRNDDGVLRREISLSWTDQCDLTTAPVIEISVVTSEFASLEDGAVTAGSVTIDGRSIRFVLSIDRAKVPPGKFTAVVRVAYSAGASTGSFSLTIRKQEPLFDTDQKIFFGPLPLSAAIAVCALALGWLRSRAGRVQGVHDALVRFVTGHSKGDVYISVVTGLGAGAGAFTAQYLADDSYALDARSALTLIVLVGGPVITAVLLILKDNAS